MTTEHRTGTGRLAVALVAIAGIALSLLVTSLFQAAAAQSETARRSEAISAIGGALQADLLRLFNQVGGFTAWIEEFGYDDPLAFAAYYDRVTAYLESVPWRAVSVAQIIDRAELDARIAELEDRRILYDAARYPRLEVFPLAGTPLAAPVLMVEPRTSRSGVFGFDLASDAQRLALIERTLAGDVPILTPPLTLSPDRFGALPEAPLSTVVWVPLRRRVETGTDSLGLLTLSVTPEHLVAAAVARASAHAFEWDIRIETDMASPEPLSGSERRIRVEHLEGDLLHAYVAGQRWEIQLRGGPPAASRQGSALVLVLSLLVTLLATALAQRVAAERSRLADALEARQIELERTRDAIADAHRVDALGRLTGGVAHDFNNLLGVIAGNLDLLRDSLEGTAREDETHFIDEALRATDRSARLTQKLLTLSRQASLSMVALDVEAVVREMAAVIDRTLPETIKSSLRLSEQTPWVRTDRVQLDSAILNLAINARDAMPEGGRIILSTEVLPADTQHGPRVQISVTDTGTGMAPETVRRALDPFFTTKDVGQGTGLGLSIVAGFVAQSGGDIVIDSVEGRGTSVRLRFPALEGFAPEQEIDVQEWTPAARSGEVVVVIEDNADLRDVIDAQLGALGYEVISAEDGRSGMLAINRAPRIDLVLSDCVLPGGMDGDAIAARLREARPGLPVLLMSGYADEPPEDAQQELPPRLTKPVKRSELAREIRRVIDGRD